MIWAAQKSGFAKYPIFGWSKQSGLYQRSPAQPFGISLATWSPPTYSPGPVGPQPRQSLAPCTWPVRQRDQDELREWMLRAPTCIAFAEVWKEEGLANGFSEGEEGTDDSLVIKLGGVGEWTDGSGDGDIPIHRELEKLSSLGSEKPASILWRLFEGIELCSERFALASQGWLWARLLPLTSASFFLAMAPAPTPRRCIPAVAHRRPRCRDPGSPRPGIRHRLPDTEARVIRHLRATEVTLRLPAAGWDLPPPGAERPRHLRREGAAKLQPSIPTHVYSSDPLNFLWPSSTATPASKWRSATVYWRSAEYHSLSWTPRIPY